MKEACLVQDGGPKKFTPEAFSENNYHGFRVEQSYTLFGASDLEKLAPGTTFNDISAFVTVDSFPDERGSCSGGHSST